MKWTVVFLHYDGAVEADKTFDNRMDAEKRAGACVKYWAQFGTTVMVLPAKMAVKISRK